MCPKDLPPTLALHMLRVGLEEERMALGLTNAAGENNCEQSVGDDGQLRQAIKAATVILERHFAAPRSE